MDEATGHYFYGFRMFDPAIARFTGVDPIADKFAWVSPYNYAENSPISNIDLWGLQSSSSISGEQINCLRECYDNRNELSTIDYSSAIDHAFGAFGYFDNRPISKYSLYRFLGGLGGMDIYSVADLKKSGRGFRKGYERLQQDINEFAGAVFNSDRTSGSHTGYTTYKNPQIGKIGMLGDFSTSIGGYGIKYYLEYSRSGDEMTGTAYVTIADTYDWDETVNATLGFVAGDHQTMITTQEIGATPFSIRAYYTVGFSITNNWWGRTSNFPDYSTLTDSPVTNHLEISPNRGYSRVSGSGFTNFGAPY
ncbi:MAG: RHS repeat-associated core domain-containing protein [Lewinella sp.]|uniref:RHS repeat-associated core domain-containing protein n=1 Tax=Lewinella sp. TaxID=2004506 RepID=UPI003D6B0F61